VSPLKLNMWRAAAFGVPMLFQYVCNHVPAADMFRSYLFLLNVYAPICTIWLGHELRTFAIRGRPLFSDIWGQATFSLYLIHTVILLNWPMTHGLWSLALYFAAIALGTWFFYILCERPSHQLARKLGDKFR
jgi:peptidoglycan/LPS O-acetylase OafA/YrhL